MLVEVVGFIDGSRALPTSVGALRRYFVVTTTGAYATTGVLYRETGTAGAALVAWPRTAIQFFVRTRIASYVPRIVYSWDGSTWVDSGPLQVTGESFILRDLEAATPVLEARDKFDERFVRLRGADPESDDDFVTRRALLAALAKPEPENPDPSIPVCVWPAGASAWGAEEEEEAT